MGTPGGRAAPSPLPYTLVEVDEAKPPLRDRVRHVDDQRMRYLVQKYAWVLSLLTMVPGIGVIAWTVTGDVVFSVAIVAGATVIPGTLFWWRTRSLP
jgi:hypothetical protein